MRWNEKLEKGKTSLDICCYKGGIIADKFYPLFALPFNLAVLTTSGISAYAAWYNMDGENGILAPLACGGYSIIIGYLGQKGFFSGARHALAQLLLGLDKLLLKLDDNFRVEHPVYYVEKITIDDKKGLDLLMEKTSKNEKKEWGVIYDSHICGENASITKIKDTNYCLKHKIITSMKKRSIRFDYNRISDNQGTHHYHPGREITWALNHHIHAVDRFNTLRMDSIDLITFNTRKGPEIVGYNRFHTFIPSNETKTELVKASYEDVVKYLGAA